MASGFVNGLMEWILLVQTRNVGLVTNIPTAEYLSAWQVLGNLEIAGSEGLAHIVYIEKTEISMVAGTCCSFIRTFHICLPQNWKTTRNQFE